MKQLWNQANYKISNQVLLRAIPALFLTAALMGAAGWVVFIKDAVDQRVLVGGQVMQAMLDQMDRAALEEGLARSVGLEPGPGPRWRVDTDEDGRVSLWPLPSFSAADGPDSSALAGWTRDNRLFLAADYNPGTWDGVRPAGAPRLREWSDDKGLLLFAPALLSNRAWQPVLLRGPEGTTLDLLPLAHLMPDLTGDYRFCLVDADNQVVHSNDARWRVGQVFSGPGPVAGGAELIGRWWRPTLALTRAGGHPLSVNCLDPMGDLHHAVSVFLLSMLATAALVLVGTVIVIRRVLGTASLQLQILSGHMEALAKGEFSRRMVKLRHDEVGSLTGFFNIMAASLEESHRQVKERASHLRAALENMRMLDQAKDDFLVLISHEVRTPLTSIMGGVDFLRKALESAGEDERRVLDGVNLGDITQIIHSSGTRLREFMNDAIQMTALGSAEARLNLRPVAVGDLLGGSLLELEKLAHSKQVAIQDELTGRADWSLLCDPEVLGVGLEKILHNAIHHNHAGGEVRIREVSAVPGQGVVADLIDRECLRRLEDQRAFHEYEDEDLVWRLVEVFNTGTPIPAERRSALFGKFELVGRIQNHQKGSGLSLPIAKAAVESHGGRILLGSEESAGNRFFILLPTLDAATVGRLESGDDEGECVGGGAWNEDIGQPGDTAGLEVELDDLCAAILGRVDEPGGGVDGPGRAHNQEDVTVGRRGE